MPGGSDLPLCSWIYTYWNYNLLLWLLVLRVEFQHSKAERAKAIMK